MNDRYLFRGKRIDNGEWVVGCYFEHLPPLVAIAPKDYVPKPSTHWIITNGDADWGLPRPKVGYEIDPATIGQCIGALMFEGDVLYDDERDEFGTIMSSWNGIIKFDEAAGRIRILDDAGDWYETDDFMFDKVIGNIHDNPELSPDAQ